MKVNWKDITIKNLAIRVSAMLEKHGISAVLVGGACISIYSHNEYLSMDLDYVSHASMKELREAMGKLGFAQKSGRHFEHLECPFLIEFPPPPIALGHEVPITRFNRIKSLKLLTPTDSVKDRLAAFYHWNDLQSLDQAVMVAQTQTINLKEIEKWSAAENKGAGFERFKAVLSKKKRGSH